MGRPTQSAHRWRLFTWTDFTFVWAIAFGLICLNEFVNSAYAIQEPHTGRLSGPESEFQNQDELTAGRTPFQQSMQETYRLGFFLRETQQGLLVISITENGPCSRLRKISDGQTVALEAGDQILTVHGRAVRTLAEYYQSMEHCSSTGGVVELAIRDVRTGQSVQLTGEATLQCVPTQRPRERDMAYRLQFDAEPAEGGGLRLTGINANGPMSRMMLPGQFHFQASAETGDVLISIDGVAVDSMASYWRTMESAILRCGQVKIELRDVRTGLVEPWHVKAIWSKIDELAQPQPQVPVTPITTPDGVRRVHILLCALTDDPSIGQQTNISLDRLKQVIADRLDQQFVASQIVLSGNQCNPTTILQTVDQFQVAPQDTLLCFYVGHGAYDAQPRDGDPSGGHFFQIPNQDLSRNALFEKLKAKRARLTVLISDTCNVRAELPPVFARVVPQLVTEQIKGLTGFEKLLLETRGEVDISASSRDQFSWFSLPEGGWFTCNFIDTVLTDESVWQNFYERLQRSTSEFYVAKRKSLLANQASLSPTVRQFLANQTDLIPMAFRFDVQEDPYTLFDLNLQREMRKTFFSFHGGLVR